MTFFSQNASNSSIYERKFALDQLTGRISLKLYLHVKSSYFIGTNCKQVPTRHRKYDQLKQKSLLHSYYQATRGITSSSP